MNVGTMKLISSMMSHSFIIQPHQVSIGAWQKCIHILSGRLWLPAARCVGFSMHQLTRVGNVFPKMHVQPARMHCSELQCSVPVNCVKIYWFLIFLNCFPPIFLASSEVPRMNVGTMKLISSMMSHSFIIPPHQVSIGAWQKCIHILSGRLWLPAARCVGFSMHQLTRVGNVFPKMHVQPARMHCSELQCSVPVNCVKIYWFLIFLNCFPPIFLASSEVPRMNVGTMKLISSMMSHSFIPNTCT